MSQIEIAVSLLIQEEIIAFPTDTVYGVAALASSINAIEKIYEIKGRDKDKPLIAMVPEEFDIEQLIEVPKEFVNEIRHLIKNHWPGELTLIFKMKKNPYIVLNYDTLGIRIPNHKVALEVINKIGVPIFVTSANRSGEPSSVTQEKVEKSLGRELSLVCSGDCGSGIASTIVSYIEGKRTIIRQGNIIVNT